MNFTFANIFSLISLVLGVIGLCNGISEAMGFVFVAIVIYRITSKFKRFEDKEELR